MCCSFYCMCKSPKGTTEFQGHYIQRDQRSERMKMLLSVNSEKYSVFVKAEMPFASYRM